MKIINILLSNKNGGVEDAFVTHCRILKDFCVSKNEVLAITKNNAPYADDLKKNNILVKEVKNNFGYYDVFAIKKIKKIINEFKADIVFAHVGKGIIFAKKALLGAKTPLIAVNHSNNVKRSIGANMVLCVNDYIRDKAISLGQNKQYVITIPNVIEFTNDELEKVKYKKFSEKKNIRIGVLGRLAKEKNLDYLFKAIKICQEKSLDTQLLIAGEGEEKENLLQLSKGLNIDKKVDFLGWIKNKQEFFANIDIFLLPSDNETFGIVILEAMKYKVPVIASNAIGPSSIIKDQQNGILVPREPLENMPLEIANTIIKLSKDQQLSENMVINASKDLQQKYSYQNLASIFDQIIRELIAKK